MNKKFLLLVILVLAGIGGFAQTQFSIYAGGAFPMGNLKAGELKTDNSGGWDNRDNKIPSKWALMYENGNQGYAGIGFNIGMDLLFPIQSVDGLGITLGADFFYNGYNSELKDYFSDLEDKDNAPTYKKPRIMNTPILLGVRYLYEVNDGFGLFAEAGAGVNLRFISSYKEEGEDNYTPYYRDGEYTKTIKYDMATTFSYRIGIGIMLAEHFSIGIDYYGLGSSKVTGKSKTEYENDYYGYDDNSDTKFKSKALDCSELALRIGYHF